ncbi:hypothetical protein GBA52_011312 [Prunus armeniaca]|nr:hypothetical protein GBA52_011312 [Prunus armeniaca]
MRKLLATILVVVAVAAAAAAARAETADYGPCIIGRDSSCNERQWRRPGGWNNLNNPPAAPSPDQLTPTLDSAEYVHDIPEIEPSSYVGL